MGAQRSARDGVATRAKLVDSAAQLFAAEGVDGVSIRAVNTQAGLAPAAVHYHFGSKEALLEAVLRADGDAVVARIVELSTALIERPARPAPREILNVLAQAYAELLNHDAQRGTRWLNIVAQLLQSEDAGLAAMSRPATDALSALAMRTFPSAPPDQLATCLRLAITSLIFLMAQMSAGVPGSPASDAELGVLVDFTTGGLMRTLKSR